MERSKYSGRAKPLLTLSIDLEDDAELPSTRGVPSNLLGAIWLQFARMLHRDITFRRCAYHECQQVFELSQQAKKKHSAYCSDSHR